MVVVGVPSIPAGFTLASLEASFTLKFTGATLTGTASRLDDYANQGVTVLAAADGYNTTTSSTSGAFA